jgi:hypothetical protein
MNQDMQSDSSLIRAIDEPVEAMLQMQGPTLGKDPDGDGTDGNDGDGTDGADTDGTDGSDTDGTDGMDTDGTDGADADGTDS